MSRPSSRSSNTRDRDRAYRDHSSDEGIIAHARRPAARRAETGDLSDSDPSDDQAKGRALASPPLPASAHKGQARGKALNSETETDTETESETEDDKPRDLEKGKPKKERRVWNMKSLASGAASPFVPASAATPSAEQGGNPQPSRKTSTRRGYAPVGAAPVGGDSSDEGHYDEKPVRTNSTSSKKSKRSKKSAVVAPAPEPKSRMWWYIGGAVVGSIIIIGIAIAVYMNHKSNTTDGDSESLSANPTSSTNGTHSANSSSNSTSKAYNGSHSSSVPLPNTGMSSDIAKPTGASSANNGMGHSGSQSASTGSQRTNNGSNGGWQATTDAAQSSQPATDLPTAGGASSNGVQGATTEDPFAFRTDSPDWHSAETNPAGTASMSSGAPPQNGIPSPTLLSNPLQTFPAQPSKGVIYSQASKPSPTPTAGGQQQPPQQPPQQPQQPQSPSWQPRPVGTPVPLPSPSPSQSFQGPFTDDFPDYDGSQTHDKYEGRATWFESSGHSSTCGTVFTDTDMVAALQPELYGSASDISPFCGAKIHVWNSATNQTISVIIEDNCPLCQGELALDLSKAAFEKLGLLDDGVLQVQWWWDDPWMPARMPANLGENVAAPATVPGAWQPAPTPSNDMVGPQPTDTSNKGKWNYVTTIQNDPWGVAASASVAAAQATPLAAPAEGAYLKRRSLKL